MSAHAFELKSQWSVPGRIEDVARILADAEAFPDWWSDVYLSVTVTRPGDADGIGRTVEIHSRGWLPYTLRWTARLIASDAPHSWSIEATGDLDGHGIWTLRQIGQTAEITYDWTVRAEKPWLRRLSPVLKPLFAWNHRWAMSKGRSALVGELARRAALSKCDQDQ